MVVFNYLPKSCEVSNTTIIANSSDKSMDLVKYFYLLRFCHSLLPFYIAPCTGRKKAAAQCFVQRLFPQIKRFIMRSAYALRINSGIIILYFAFVALCGARQTLFSQEGSQRQPAVLPVRELALSVTYGDSSPKGRALGSPRKLHLFAKASPFGRGGIAQR